jgi:N-acyl-D-aspartate/D-glutamate deacylase
MLTEMPADLYGLNDRSVIEVGKKADINVISLNTLELNMPYIARDLPTGAPRLVQGAEGYVMAMVNGEISHRNGKDTGARPGGLVRRHAN